jgi:parallel beta-helix repeat protein
MPVAVVVALVLALAVPVRAADHWVKNGGDDAADGLSVGTAWATLGHAADEVDPGDTVHVLDGSYQGFYVERSGTPGNPITFKAEGPAVLITADNGRTPDGINVENAAHVVIDGFVVNDRTRTGVRTAVSQFVTIRNCTLGNNGRWGILTGFADDVTIENNVAHHSQIEHGIYVGNSADRPVIRGNHVYDNHANGIHMNGDASLGGDGVISNALVEGNVIHGNGAAGGSGINMDGVSDSVIRNNLLYDNHASGISLYRIDGGTGSQRNLVVNNTVVVAADGRWALNVNNGSSGNRALNNVFYTFHSFRGAISIDDTSLPGFVSDYNALMDRFSVNGGNSVIGLTAWRARGFEAHSFLASPSDLFVTPGVDFHLSPTSPALDAGTLTDVPVVDLDGNPRPVGTAVDVGAYETQLLECGDGNVDPGEQCGEPGLGACADPCRHCAGCTCALSAPVCGDGLVCGAETCETAGDCAAGQACIGCRCENPSACLSGATVRRPRMKMAAAPFALVLKGEAVILAEVDPALTGIRIVIDGESGPGGIDVVIPGGSGWRVNAKGTRWDYANPAGPITKATVLDRARIQAGLVRWVVRGKGGSVVLPPVGSTRSAVVLGASGECASIAWNGPGEPRPRCDGGTSRLSCH